MTHVKNRTKKELAPKIAMQYFDFEGGKLSKVFKGNWQLAGGHGTIEREQAITDLYKHVNHGVNVFDVGDIYTGAEEIVGDFLKSYRQSHGETAFLKLRVHTKFVPDLDSLSDLTLKDVRKIIKRSLDRLGISKLHLVQFHWWDFGVGNFVEAARHLDELRKEGLIEHIGVTNFDCAHLQLLLDAGIPIKSNQVQFSLIDPRPFNGMLQLAKENDIAIFCYGVLAGGLLGRTNPIYDPANRSHVKYGLMIDEVGKDYYRSVLSELKDLAKKHETTVADVAIRYVLQTPGVDSVILGPRNTKHIAELDNLFGFKLPQDEYNRLFALQRQKLLSIQDDIYSYERKVDSPHGRIMKYNLNGMRPRP